MNRDGQVQTGIFFFIQNENCYYLKKKIDKKKEKENLTIVVNFFTKKKKKTIVVIKLRNVRPASDCLLGGPIYHGNGVQVNHTASFS